MIKLVGMKVNHIKSFITLVYQIAFVYNLKNRVST
jgi:hypothetical protein